MKNLLFLLALAVATPIATTSCKSQVTLEAGGAYTEATLAVTDQSILDASKTLTGFLEWNSANATFLARWPEVGALATRVAAQKDGWIRDAYAARDAYASAAIAWRAAGAPAVGAPEVERRRAAINGSLAVLKSVTEQITAYRTSHSRA